MRLVRLRECALCAFRHTLCAPTGTHCCTCPSCISCHSTRLICLLATGDPDFHKHPLADKEWQSLHLLQQWAATKLGWTEATWNNDSFVPGPFTSNMTATLPKPYEKSLLKFMGQKRNTAGTKTIAGPDCFVDDDGKDLNVAPTITAHYMITRILRYTIKTYAAAISNSYRIFTCLPFPTYLQLAW